MLMKLAYPLPRKSPDHALDSMNLPSSEVRSELEAAKADLGAAEAPEGVEAGTAAHFERAVEESFVAGFRTVMLVCVGLALASALAAALLVGDRRVHRTRYHRGRSEAEEDVYFEHYAPT